MINDEKLSIETESGLADSMTAPVLNSNQYDPHITKEQWKQYIEEVELPNHKGCIKMLKGIFLLGGEASPKKLSEVYGGSPYSYNASAINIGRRAKKYFGIQAPTYGASESIASIPFSGRVVNEKGSSYYAFILRDELFAALKEIDLSGIDPYTSKAWLLAWNKDNWEWNNYTEECSQTRDGEPIEVSWSCVSIGPQIGDEVFLIKLGKAPRGIIAHGTVTSPSYLRDPYDPDKAEEGRRERAIDVAFDRVLNYESESIISQDELKTKCAEQHWSPQSSGIEIRKSVLPVLHTLWENVAGEENEFEFDRNLILYGPPGTGKTYNAVIYAVSICDGTSTDDLKKEKYSDVLARYRELKEEGRIAFTTFHQSYGYEEFIEGIKPKMMEDNASVGYYVTDGLFKAFCSRAEKAKKPYVFIIDEINRGNISKIFGELITLIEDTKRAGAKEAMEAILPYSGEVFSVPDNVCILGTMNTADRSIALLDTALRRRFRFMEMMPDSEVLESLGIGKISIGESQLNIARMLDVMNRRIEFLYDREHTIGHAFFMKLMQDPSIEALAGIFEKSIIPMLQEYFYEDYEKIQLVLGDNNKEDKYKFILDRPVKIRDIFMGSPDLDQPEKGYSIQKEAFLELESYKQIGKDL